MTCKGYDPRSVTVHKSVKRLAANYLDSHKRGEIIRSYVRILEEQRKTGRKDSK